MALAGSSSQFRSKLICIASRAVDRSVWVSPMLTRFGVASSEVYPGSSRTASALPADSVQTVATMSSAGTRYALAAALTAWAYRSQTRVAVIGCPALRSTPLSWISTPRGVTRQLTPSWKAWKSPRPIVMSQDNADGGGDQAEAGPHQRLNGLVRGRVEHLALDRDRHAALGVGLARAGERHRRVADGDGQRLVVVRRAVQLGQQRRQHDLVSRDLGRVVGVLFQLCLGADLDVELGALLQDKRAGQLDVGPRFERSLHVQLASGRVDTVGGVDAGAGVAEAEVRRRADAAPEQACAARDVGVQRDGLLLDVEAAAGVELLHVHVRLEVDPLPLVGRRHQVVNQGQLLQVDDALVHRPVLVLGHLLE